DLPRQFARTCGCEGAPHGASLTPAARTSRTPTRRPRGRFSFMASITASALDRRNVAGNGFFQHLLCILLDDAIKIVPVDHIELERAHGLADLLDLALRQRKEIRIAAHEGEPFPVLGDGQDVPRANDAASAVTSRPVNDRTARKMSAAAHQRDAIPELERVALPQLDRRPFAHDPIL